MEIAIHQQETGVQVYVEGISWTAITEYFQAETVNIYLLVFVIDGKYTSHDSRVELTDDKLTFCKQSVVVKELLSRLKEMELNYPNEVRIGNKHFLINQLFPDGYVLTFWDKEHADKFITGITEKYLSGIKSAITNNKDFSTKGLNDDYVTSPNFDRFIDKRCNRWNDAVVKEFEDGVKNGTIICEGCSDES